MKERVIVRRGDYTLYDGNVLNLPLKDKYITELSIEIFDDVVDFTDISSLTFELVVK